MDITYPAQGTGEGVGWGGSGISHIHASMYVEYALKTITPVQNNKLGWYNGSKLGKI